MSAPAMNPVASEIMCSSFHNLGESRTDLIERNLEIVESSIIDMTPCGKHTVLPVVANPVDVFTYYAQKFRNCQSSKYLAATQVDSARLRGILANKCGAAASSINAYVLGEHGESQVVAWSHIAIGDIPIEQLTIAAEDAVDIDRLAVAEDTKQKASAIVENEGSTAFGTAAVVVSVCRSWPHDTRDVLTISHFQYEFGICLSTRFLLVRKGITKRIEMPLEKAEQQALLKSAKSLSEVVSEAEGKQKGSK
ncbi:hypothetical protein N0V82_006876 [Gnomoniopsis sp. IMI 355080]|nr:hypothetical protein N0V82_006876 [Gnomoniopsis sp. IMI 355080]